MLVGILAFALVSVPTIQFALDSPAAAGGPRSVSAQADLLIRVVRTLPTEASVLGIAITANDSVELLVNGQVVATQRPLWNLDYWFVHVAVSDGSQIQTRIGPLASPTVTVPAYANQPVGPSGFIYAKGATLMRNGAPIQLSGVNEQTSFIYAMIASDLFGWSNPGNFWGNNQLFPSGPETKIPGVDTPDEVWREFFRYFLHYQQVSGSASYPKPNMLRIWVIDPNFGPENEYKAWKSNPTKYWEIWDRLVYWADRAGVYLVPVLGNSQGMATNAGFYDTSSTLYQHHVEFVRAIMSRFNDNPRIAMWDIWNEADVNNDVYWASVGGIDGYKAWASKYIRDVEGSSSNHLITLGTGGWTLFPGVPSFGWRYHLFFNDIPGLDVSHHHGYATAEDQYLIDWQTGWQQALGIPHLEGEYGYNLWPGPNPSGYGYWPWYTERARAAGWPAISTMVLWDNGRGPFVDYPYFGSLPEYPSEGAPPPDVPPVATFDFSPAAPTAGEEVVFDASASSDDVGIATYAWSFGDAGTASGVTARHAFSAAGDYTVTLTVTDTRGQSDGASATVRVSAPPPPPDTTPPVRIADLRALASGPDSIILRWTAPGDDGVEGRAQSYDIRMSAAGPIDSTNFAFATSVTAPVPTIAGTVETVTVSGLDPGVEYWFALRAADEVPNLSELSNSPSAETAAEPPAPPIPPPKGIPEVKVTAVRVSFDPSRVALAFSADMNRTSVESAIAVDPSVPYLIQWEDGSHLQLVFAGPLESRMSYLLLLASTAAAVDGRHMSDPFTFSFSPAEAQGIQTPSWSMAIGPWVALALPFGTAALILGVFALLAPKVAARSGRPWRRSVSAGGILFLRNLLAHWK